MMTPRASQRQEQHYEAIHDDYADHYYDPESLRYRDRYVLGPLLSGLDFNGKRVADLACGDGFTSRALKDRFPAIELIGFDISPTACNAYQHNSGFPALQIDLTSPEFRYTGNPFDAAIIIGGIHHCVNDLDATFGQIARLLKPDGYLLMCEPNAASIFDPIRRLWYRLDRYFDAETEHALHHEQLAARYADLFAVESVRYFGGPGYFLVLNSLVCRVPLRLKPALSPVLFAAEAIYNKLPGSWPFAAFWARWRRL